MAAKMRKCDHCKSRQSEKMLAQYMGAWLCRWKTGNRSKSCLAEVQESLGPRR